jgi:glycosyltransferase involved in cell wall biosynthesis
MALKALIHTLIKIRIMDLISVIVPIYNLDAYLYQCVHSILNQSYKNLEVVLVDDGSTDNALEICEFFKKADLRVKVVSQVNSGLVSARKAGLDASTGSYVFYVDGDDWIDPDCINQYYSYAKKFNVEIVIGDYKREFLGNFVTIKNSLLVGYYDRQSIEKKILPKMICDGSIFNHGLKTYSWGKLYRRELIENLQKQIPDEVIVGEDAALLYPAIDAASSIYITNLNCCNYRQRPNSILKTINFDANEIKRIARAFSYMTLALKKNLNHFNYIWQLQAYYVAITAIRAGGFLGDTVKYKQFNFFGDIPLGSRLAIYNSGSFGQHVYKHLSSNADFNLVAWFDHDFNENQLLKMPVYDPQIICSYSFDLILVPSFDPTIIQEVYDLFEINNIDKLKVRNINFDINKMEQYIELTGFDSKSFLPLH